VFPAINEHFGMTTPEAIALGAVPFVHDSGGQREIVNNPKFRFVDSEFMEKFDTIFNLNLDELDVARMSLAKHVHTFSEEVFVSRMLERIRNHH
jgi:glycosyltransferase involved in cell wall biosynthesis